MPAAAILAAGALGAGATIFGANKAASAQTKATQQATDAQLRMFNLTRESLEPFIQGGAQSSDTMNRLITPDGGVDMSVLEKLPGYEFARTQGLKAVNNMLGARGLGNSPGALVKGAANFVTGLADQTFGEQFNRLLESSRIGANAAAGLGSNATQTGSNIGSNMVGAGNAQAAAANALGAGGQMFASAVPTSMYANRMLGPTGQAAAASPAWQAGYGFQGIY